jgi:hypothetical protein
MSTQLQSRVKAAQRPSFTPVRTNLLQRKCACGQPTIAGGECEACRKKGEGLPHRSVFQTRVSAAPTSAPDALPAPNQPLDAGTHVLLGSRFGHDFSSVPLGFQAKLRVSQPGDRYEQEADRVTEQVMRMATPKEPVPTNHEQSKRAAYEKGVQKVQRQEIAPTVGFEVSGDVARGISSLRGGGSPLNASTRAFMEPRFGHDFSQVRVHSDARAAQLAQSVNALAFTMGQDVVFESGRYAPETDWGRRLLAHELTHVVQQGAQPAGSTLFRLTPAMCASSAGCAAPDTAGLGPASSWKLTLAVDKEEEGLGRLISGDVGHTWVKLSDDAGTKYSYGFWPQTGFNREKPLSTVDGCVHHPDTAHEPPDATNYLAIDYALTNANYLKALNHAQSVCQARPGYNLVSYNCTTFAIDVVKAAEVSPPSSTTLAIHNPNALYEGIEEKRGEGHPGLGALLGGLGGAAGGAAIGSLLGPVGAIVGGLIGGIAGAVSGALIGDVT